MKQTGGIKARFKNTCFVAMSLVFMMFGFQNCGTEMQTGTNNLSLNPDGFSDCLSNLVDCGPQSSFLEIALDLTDPSILPQNQTSLEVYGRCNAGNYLDHDIVIRVLDGNNNLVGSETRVPNLCFNGLFDRVINISSLNLIINRRYTLEVEIFGVDDQGSFIRSTSASGRSAIDFSVQ